MENSETDDKICNDEDIYKLLMHFAKSNHRVKNADIKGETVLEKCILLFSRDYKFTLVPNLNGELCSHYPMKLIIAEYEQSGQTYDEHVESRYHQQDISHMMKNARCARCRSRFVAPVILYQGKHICRSATLSGAAEMFGRSTSDYFMSNQNSQSSQGNSEPSRPDMFDKFRGHDIQLLKYFDVEYICDLMVEKKKMKFGLPLSSSEKVDKENRYSDFSILGMPYPGCEFFKEWKDNFYDGETTQYNWEMSLNDSSLDLPSTPYANDLGIDWTKYKEWNLVELTQNYLKLLLKYIKEAPGGLLVHCISGWDRTPLFISLLRLSLWADGLIHTSLNPTEMLYLTLGYDWYLFGHDLPERLSNDEEVMFFCFKVLKDITSQSFSLNARPVFPTTHTGSPSSPPVQQPQPAQQSSPSTQASSSPRQQQQAQPSQSPQAPPVPLQAPQLQREQLRVDSDSNLGIQGVLLADDLMTFPNKGSCSSLNSLGSSEGPVDAINFCIGDIQEEDEDESRGANAGRKTSKYTSIQHQRSMSPLTHASPVLRHSSPINTVAGGRNRRKSSSDGQGLSIQSNHFMSSPLGRASSPMCVPRTRAEEGVTNPLMINSPSVGSWQIIPSLDNTRSMDSPHSHSNSNSSAEKISQGNNSSQGGSYERQMTSVRCQRLDTVSQLFQSAYIRAVPSSHTRTSSGLTSLFGRFAEQVGLRGGGGGGTGGGGGGAANNTSSSRRGV